MAKHVAGSMDTSAQEKTFEGFVKVTVRTVVFIFCVLVFIALVNA